LVSRIFEVTGQASKYWLQRFAQAIESAVDAPGEQSRKAYLDLADHYWSMHVLVHGLSNSARNRPPGSGPGARRSDSAPALQWAA
jgi:hypothetical protein